MSERVGHASRLARKHGYRLRSIWTMLTGFANSLQTVRIFTGVGAPDAPVIRIRGGENLTFRVRGAMDVWCLKESVLDRCYERYGFTIQPGWTVIDIGAGFGDFTTLAADAAGPGRVHAFEPDLESFALLEHNTRLNEVTATLHATAITGRPRVLTLDRSSGEPLMFESVDADANGAGEIVPSETLTGAVAAHGIDTIDLLKLDCEGAEFDILRNSPSIVPGRVLRIVAEVHTNGPDQDRDALAAFLEQAGYVVEVFPSPVHPDDLAYLRAARRDLAGQESVSVPDKE